MNSSNLFEVNQEVRDSLKEEIENHRETLIARYQKKSFRHQYIEQLQKVLELANKSLGGKISLRAFGRHFALASIYGFGFFLIGYTIYGQYTIDYLTFLPSDDRWWMRFTRALSIPTLLVIFFWLVGEKERLNKYIDRLVDNKVIGIIGIVALGLALVLVLAGNVGLIIVAEFKGDDILSHVIFVGFWLMIPVLITIKLGLRVMGILLIVDLGLIALVAGLGSVVVGLGMDEIGILAAGFGLGLVGLGMGGFSLVGGLGVVLGTVLAVSVLGLYARSYMPFFMFFLLFPLFNGSMGMLSTGISRWLGEKMLLNLKSGNRMGFWCHLIVNAAVALLASLLLYEMIVVMINSSVYYEMAYHALYLNNIVPLEYNMALDTPAIFNAWGEDPFQNHLWFTLMLVSTWIPMLYHLVIALTTKLSFGHKQEGDLIKYLQAGQDGLALDVYCKIVKRDRLLSNVYLARILSLLKIIALLGVGVLGLGLLKLLGVWNYFLEIM